MTSLMASLADIGIHVFYALRGGPRPPQTPTAPTTAAPRSKKKKSSIEESGDEGDGGDEKKSESRHKEAAKTLMNPEASVKGGEGGTEMV